MPRNRNLTMLSTALTCSVVMAWLCISIRGESSYEIRPRITVPHPADSMLSVSARTKVRDPKNITIQNVRLRYLVSASLALAV